ncbi:hypothetical protein [Vampirovibrio sp.]|uniref:hypothetical protein n=1 Tax=Vampirovibrio sp. TaxID=2717857 RepID=UPI0035944172
MCNNHDVPISDPQGQECHVANPVGMDLADFVALAQNDRETAIQVFMKDVPSAYLDEANRPLLEQAFDGYIAFLNEQQQQQAPQEKKHVPC